MENVIRNIETNTNLTIVNRMIQHIAYADEVMIMDDLASAREEVATQINEPGLVI